MTRRTKRVAPTTLTPGGGAARQQEAFRKHLELRDAEALVIARAKAAVQLRPRSAQFDPLVAAVQHLLELEARYP